MLHPSQNILLLVGIAGPVGCHGGVLANFSPHASTRRARGTRMLPPIPRAVDEGHSTQVYGSLPPGRRAPHDATLLNLSLLNVAKSQSVWPRRPPPSDPRLHADGGRHWSAIVSNVSLLANWILPHNMQKKGSRKFHRECDGLGFSDWPWLSRL